MPSASDQHDLTNPTSLMAGILIADRTEAELSREHYYRAYSVAASAPMSKIE